MKRKLSKILGIALTVAMLASLLVAAAPAAALSQPVVTVSDDTISATNVEYTVMFTVDKQLSGNTTVQDTITITFPEGTSINTTANTSSSIQASPGWVAAAPSPLAYNNTSANALGAVFDAVAADRTLTFKMPATGQYIGQGAQVLIKVTAGITNPADPGTAYAVTVKTSQETTAVTSNAYSVKEPTLTELPGVARAYNSAGIQMDQGTVITTALMNKAGQNGKIELTAGTYTTIDPFVVPGLTVVGIEDGVIFDDNVAINGKGITLENVTLKSKVGGTNVIAIAAAGLDAVIKNVTVSADANAQAIAIAADGATIESCTIEADKTIGINTANTTTITNSTITVDTGGIAINSNNDITLKNSTITGSSGTGISHTSVAGKPGAVATVEANVFKTLNTAITFAGNSVVNAKENTIEECGSATATTVIEANSTNTSAFTNNTIQNTNAKSYAFKVIAAGTLNANFNNIVNNTLNVERTAGTANFKLNWWGTPDGAATTSIKGTVDVTSPLGAMPGAGTSTAAYASSTLTGKTTSAVDINAVTAGGVASAMTEAGTSKLEDNPVDTVPPIYGTGEIVGYWDIYVNPAAATDVLTIKIYSTSVSEYTKVYYGGGLSGSWSLASNQGVNVAGGYAWFTTDTTTTPTTSDLTGTPFALVEDKTLAAPSLAVGSGTSPALGAYDIDVDTTFTWGAVAAVAGYQIEVSEDPTFTMKAFEAETTDPFYKTAEALSADTTYYWRVRGVIDAAASAYTPWATGIFTTAAAGTGTGTGTTAPTEVIVTTETPEVQVVQVEGGSTTPAIPTYLLWVIVVVGVVLVVALIVLIVRTRRVA